MQVTPLLVIDATTLNVAVSGVVPLLVALKAGILPVPLLIPRPMASFVRDHEKTAPCTSLMKIIEGTEAPAQTV